MTGNIKYVLSLNVARHLLAKGFRLIDIEPARKFDGLTFLFEDTPELNKEMHNYSLERKERRKEN